MSRIGVRVLGGAAALCAFAASAAAEVDDVSTERLMECVGEIGQIYALAAGTGADADQQSPSVATYRDLAGRVMSDAAARLRSEGLSDAEIEDQVRLQAERKAHDFNAALTDGGGPDYINQSIERANACVVELYEQ